MKNYWFLVVIMLSFTGCFIDDADVASYNLSKKADMFQITRRVVFYNGITGDYMLVIEGRCSVEIDRLDKQLELTVKTGDNTYKKHFLGLSDNVTYFAEQISDMPIDVYHYRVIFKPSTIIPTIQVK